MKLNLQSVTRVKNISKTDFIKNYVKPQKPVVIEEMVNDWPAVQKWIDKKNEKAIKRTNAAL